MLARDINALKIVFDNLKEAVGVAVEQVKIHLDVGGAVVVDQDIDAPFLGDNLVHHRAKGFLLARVEVDNVRLTASSDDLPRYLLSRFQVADRQIDLGAVFRQLLGAGQADASGGGGDQRDLVFTKFHLTSVPFSQADSDGLLILL